MAIVKKCRTTDVTDRHRLCEVFVGDGGLIFD
jgi:hypothetical protein